MAPKTTVKVTPIMLRKRKPDLVIPDSASSIPDWDSSMIFGQPRTPIPYPPNRTPDPPSSIPNGQPRTPIPFPPYHTPERSYSPVQDGRSHENKDNPREREKRKGTRREPRQSGECMSQTRGQEEEDQEQEKEKVGGRETKK